MTTKADKGKHSSGDNKLLAIADRLALKVANRPEWTWSAAVYTALIANPTDRNMLRLAIRLREDGKDDSDERFCEIASRVSDMAFDRMGKDKEWRRIHKTIEEAEKKHGRAYDTLFDRVGAPDDIRQLHVALDKRKHQIQAQILYEYGGFDMANLLLVNPAEYHRRVAAGRVVMVKEWKQRLTDGTADKETAFLHIAAAAESEARVRSWADPEYRRIIQAIHEIEKANGLEHGQYGSDKEPRPPEVEKLFAALDARENAINVAMLREAGADDMADMLQNDKPGFDKRFEECREAMKAKEAKPDGGPGGLVK